MEVRYGVLVVIEMLIERDSCVGPFLYWILRMWPALLPFSSMYANGSIHLVVSLSSFIELDRGYVERERNGGGAREQSSDLLT